ncbi:MAG: discoidin domain-containing protein [Melioribacteraceae bacterium]|nr:discoidin domain-containing protein [Melioribacteraceae bacterium]
MKLRILIYLFFVSIIINGQQRIEFNGQQLFLSGSNVAWVNFARDIGPGNNNIAKFKSYFGNISKNGGNSIRFWLHTTGQSTPQFDSQGFVVGPGEGSIADLKAILDAAWENNVGMVLSLWSFDMMRSSIGSFYLDRNRKLLNDTSYTNSYIRNSLIPMVRAIKDHPALISWELFNEPEGMSVEFGWKDITSADIPMNSIQRFINLVTGAIHREAPSNKVTNGSWAFLASTDQNNYAKISNDYLIENLFSSEKETITKHFNEKYNTNLTFEEVLENFHYQIQANANYYRDDRLIAAGGDPLGTLDFYQVHYYDWAGQTLSPFHYNVDHWLLDKKLIVGEFYVTNTFGISYKDLYKNLIEKGYAGALDWGWDNVTYASKAAENMEYLYDNFPYDVVLNPISGTIYSFNADKAIAEKGDTVKVIWKTAENSNTLLNNSPVNYFGQENHVINGNIDFTLKTSGTAPSTRTINIDVLPIGKIISASINTAAVDSGGSVILTYQATRGSHVTLNGEVIPISSTLLLYPDKNPTDYLLKSVGEITDSILFKVFIIPQSEINRAANAVVTSSSNEEGGGHEKPEYAIDGNPFTTWYSGNANLQWFEMDLGDNFSINKMNIFWDKSSAQNYRIAIGYEKTSYKLAKQISGGTGGYEEHADLNNNKGRYIKLLLDKKSNSNLGYSINEIEIYGTRLTDITENEFEMPSDFKLMQNYPNPFNPTTTITYQVPEAGKVRLEIYDLLGRKVVTLIDTEVASGSYNIILDAAKLNLNSGVYFYRLFSWKYSQTRKMVLVK